MGSPERSSPVSGDHLLDEVERISRLGNRFMGSAGEAAARDYLCEGLAAAGTQDIHLEPVTYLGIDDATASCRVIGENELELVCTPLQYTASAVVEGSAIYLGTCDAAQLAELDRSGGTLQGMVAVVEPPLIMFVGEELATRGAIAIVNLSTTLSNDPGHFVARFPAPAPADAADWPLPIPGITLDAASGRRLLVRLTAGATRIRVEQRSVFARSESSNVVGLLPGAERSRLVVVGAHYDSQRSGLGAADNATGLATLLELARRWPARPPRHGIALVAFAAEELGSWGARAFVEDDPARTAETIAMLNLDALGNPISATRTVIATPDLHDLAAETAAGVGWKPEAAIDARSAAFGDSWPFIAAGVPSCWLFRYPPNHPYYHTEDDIPRHVDATRLGEDAAASIALALRLADLPPEHPLVRRTTPAE